MLSSSPAGAASPYGRPFCAMSFGEFVLADQYFGDQLSDGKPDFPALRVDFDPVRTSCIAGDTIALDWRLLTVGDATAFATRMQCGPDVFYGVGDLSDQRLWACLDRWASAKHMAYVHTFDAGTSAAFTLPFGMSPELEALRPASGHAQTSRSFESDLLALDILQRLVEKEVSAVPGIATVRNVQLSIIRTDADEATGIFINPRFDGEEHYANSLRFNPRD